MKRGHARRTAAGTIIVLLSLGLALAIFFLDQLRGLWQDRLNLYAVFSSAPRLRVGAPVWINGHRVGVVRALSFLPVDADSAPAVVARLEIPGRQRAWLPRGSSVRLTTPRFVGDAVVDIAPGPAGQPLLHDGDTLFAMVPGPQRSLAVSLQDFQQTLSALLETTRTLAPAVDRRVSQYALLNERFEDVGVELAALRRLLGNGLVGRWLNDASLQQRIQAIAQTARELGPALQDAAQRARDPALRQAISSLQDRVSTLSAQLAVVSDRIGQSSLTRFQQDSAISKALRQAQIELDSLIAETRRNPLRYWRGDNRKPE